MKDAAEGRGVSSRSQKRPGSKSASPYLPTLYSVIEQDAETVKDPENSPSLLMPRYLLQEHRQSHLGRISVYAERGTSAAAVRLLYMNAAALALWREMGRTASVRATRHRPPPSSELIFGVPWSD